MRVSLMNVVALIVAGTQFCLSNVASGQSEAGSGTGVLAISSHWLHDLHSDCWIYYPWDSSQTVSISWSGACTDHQASGQGTFTLTRTFAIVTLTGTFDKGLIEGQGTLVTEDSERMEGNFRGGLMNGQGTVVWPDGTRYEGSFVNQHFEGEGKLSWPNGDFYEGEFVHGVLQGQGQITNADGSTFEGHFRDGELMGEVRSRSPDGTRLSGSFVLPRADPKLDLPQPSFTTARLKLDQQAIVVLRYLVKKDGNVADVRYIQTSGISEIDRAALDTVAQWHFVPASVSGTPVDYKINQNFTVSRVIKNWGQGGHYEGDCVNGGFQGQGKIAWPGGDTYVGSFNMGLEGGRGVYTYADGTVIDGNFRGGVVYGHAVFRKPDGTRIEGEFLAPHIDPAFPMPEVEYPASAVRAGRTGSVIVRYTVGVDGSVHSARILYYSGTPDLDDEAIAEVFRTHMVPGTLNGKPFELTAIRKIVFELRN